MREPGRLSFDDHGGAGRTHSGVFGMSLGVVEDCIVGSVERDRKDVGYFPLDLEQAAPHDFRRDAAGHLTGGVTPHSVCHKDEAAPAPCLIVRWKYERDRVFVDGSDAPDVGEHRADDAQSRCKRLPCHEEAYCVRCGVRRSRPCLIGTA